jgi:hypothetical protein
MGCFVVVVMTQARLKEGSVRRSGPKRKREYGGRLLAPPGVIGKTKDAEAADETDEKLTRRNPSAVGSGVTTGLLSLSTAPEPRKKERIVRINS